MIRKILITLFLALTLAIGFFLGNRYQEKRTEENRVIDMVPKKPSYKIVITPDSRRAV